MIVPGQTDKQIAKELHRDQMHIRQEAKKKFRKQLQKLIASGMNSKELTFDYETITPSNNRWAVTATVKAGRKKPFEVRCCCIVEQERNRDYLVLRGTSWGGMFYLRIYSHAISRMKERDKRFAGLESGAVCNRIFRQGENGCSLFTEEEDIRHFYTTDVQEDVNMMMVTSSGVFFGRHFRNKEKEVCHVNIKTFITPNMLATHEQHDMYRCAVANIKLEKHLIETHIGFNSMVRLKKTKEANELMNILMEYRSELKFISGMMNVPE